VRILLVADIVGGVRTFARELARDLAGHGIEVNHALLGSDHRTEFAGLGARSCRVRGLRLEWMEEPWEDVDAAGEWIEALRAEHHPDLLHLNTFTPVLDPDVPVLLTVHSCVLTWWRAVFAHDAPAAWQRYRQLAQRAFDRANLMTVPTHALRDELRAVYERLPPTRVIVNGRTRAGGWPLPSARRERLVLSVGRIWDRAKNARLVAAAAGAINAPVTLIGPGHIEGVTCLGPMEETDVLSWLSRASLFVEPARYEPFGLAALEAALCGCALVLGDIPSLREVWDDGATFVSPDDPDALARAVNTLLDDPARRNRAASDALAIAAGYPQSANTDAYLAAYRQLVRE
jgi:glycosyltransferase involved in cell wall biosynthesis